MLLTEKNYIKEINAFSEDRWKPLIDLIPVIEQTRELGKIEYQGVNEDGTFLFPYFQPGEVVTRFLEIVYEIPIIINFDWGNWEEGRNILSDENFDFNTLDLPSICKLLTALVRQDRFVEGSLNSAFKSGLILRLLISIRKNLENHEE